MRARTVTAVGALLSLVASMFIGIAAPMAANAAGNTEPSLGLGTQTLYAYVEAGESVSVSGTMGTPELVASDGTEYQGTGTHGPATEAGVWSITLGALGTNVGYTWDVDVVDGGTALPGRVWSEGYSTRQDVSDDADMNYWLVNDNGYVYEVSLAGYNGINSVIRANSVGWTDDACEPTYASFEYSPLPDAQVAAPPIPDCGDTYRVFFEEPAADLPASASTADGVVPVLPEVVGTDDLVVDDLAFTPVSGGAATGTFTYSINESFTGGYALQIDVDGDGAYDGPRDRTISLGANGTGEYSYDFDGLDGQGEEIGQCVQLSARIYFDKLGEVHVLQSDVEGRSGGIEIIRTTGAGAPDSTIYWDDTQMVGNRATTTSPTSALDGVSSSGGVHGWSYHENGWGNNRIVDDWTYLPADFGTGEIQFGGRCLDIEKTSDATENTRVGDTVTYQVTATNTGDTDYTADEPAVVTDDLSGVLDDATYNEDATADQDGDIAYAEPKLSWSGPLAAGASVTLEYTTTVKSGGDGVVRNVAFAGSPEDPTPVCDPPTEDGVDPETNVPCAETEYELPRLTIEKSASETELPSVGGEVTYTVTATNEGPGDFTDDAPAVVTDDLSEVLDDATYNDDAEANLPGDVEYDEPELRWQGALAAGESVTIQYTVTYTGEGDHRLVNTACVPESDAAPGADPCAVVSVPGASLEQWKSVEASDDPVVAGTVLTYTLFFENTGESAATVDSIDDLTHVTDDADVTTEPSSDGLDVSRDGNRIAITGSVAAGDTTTVTYQVTLKADGERGDDIAANFLMANDPEDPPVPPEDPVCTPTDDERPDCTVTPVGMLETAKQVESDSDPVGTGSVLTYTLTFHNAGEGPVEVDHDDILTDVLDDAELTTAPQASDSALTVSDVVDDRFTVSGVLDGGQTVTVTYSVTVKEEIARGNNSADNYLVPTGADEPPSCDDDDPNCTVTKLPNIDVEKSADPESGSAVQAGQDITYTLTFSNTGEAAGAVDYTDDLTGVLDDADLVGAPTSDDGLEATDGSDGRIRITGSLEPGQTATVSYTVTVKADGERGDNELQNVVAQSNHENPECGDDGVECTEHRAGQLEDWKTVDPASGTTVQGGSELTYTLHFENTGKAAVDVDREDDLTDVLDDADVTSDPVASDDALTVSEIADGRFRVSGSLEPGALVTVTYHVTVKADGERGDDRLGNYLVDPGEEPPAECAPADGERPDCTVNHVNDVTVEKASDPESGTEVVPGDDVTYTVTFTNTSKNPTAEPVDIDYTDHMVDVLDDAELTSGPTASSESVTAVSEGDTIRIVGSVASGETITVTYTVTVNDQADRGDGHLGNVVAVTGEAPVCAPESPLCTEHDVPLPGPDTPDDGLAVTGGTVGIAGALAVLVLLTAGGALLAFGRRRRDAEGAVGR